MSLFWVPKYMKYRCITEIKSLQIDSFLKWIDLPAI